MKRGEEQRSSVIVMRKGRSYIAIKFRIRGSFHVIENQNETKLTFILLRGVGLTPLRPLPLPLLTSASSLPICLIAAMPTISGLESRPPRSWKRAKDEISHTYIGRVDTGRSPEISTAVGGTRLRSRLHLSSAFDDFECSQDRISSAAIAILSLSRARAVVSSARAAISIVSVIEAAT